MSDTAIQFNLPTLIVDGVPPDPSLLMYVKLEVSGSEDFAAILLAADTGTSVSRWRVADDDEDGEMVAWPSGGLPTLHLGCAAYYRIGTSLAAGDYYVRVSLRDAETADVINWDTGLPYKTWAWTCTTPSPSPSPSPPPPPAGGLMAPHIYLKDDGTGTSMTVRVEGDNAAWHIIVYHADGSSAWLTAGAVFGNTTHQITGLVAQVKYYVKARSWRGAGVSEYSATRTLRLMAEAVGARPLAYQQWWFDMPLQAFSPVRLAEAHSPTAILAHRSDDAESADVILGGSDGYLRRFTPASDSDDGVLFDSWVIFGPLRQADRGQRGVLRELQGMLSEDSGDVQYGVRASDTPESCVSADLCASGLWASSRKVNVSRPRTGGAATLVSIQNGEPNRKWALESMAVDIAGTGKRRRL